MVRIGDTVRRPLQPWSPAVHALLRHLEAAGFPAAPRFLGVDEQGREVLTHVEGESGPQGWAHVVPDDGLVRFAHLLRDYHDAVADFEPPGGVTWFAAPPAGLGPADVILHGDFGPWNVVWRDGRPVAIIDWDLARPGPRRYDLAYALEYLAPFRDDAECLRWLRYPAPPDRGRRLRLFTAAYGSPAASASADELVDDVLAVQREGLDAVRRLAEAGQQPQSDWVAAGHLDELRSRIAWTAAHRALFAASA
ncbi:aminoglycoside phosphotransferase family protein [Jiangella rhizosphaerae]|uniref:Aminoglycoside phosphotransferase family protein n=1 Tax=Jiangella rhizosphaerae TaxID=2293569 RepID=A0A418KWY7_9ACTN|nr:aminoglycoside phosphotransferase family protein [Jiangella rhizosphaerae]